jgi:hypothetical protein
MSGGWQGGWSYAGGCAIHNEFCDTAGGSGRGKEGEDGREGKYNGVNRGEPIGEAETSRFLACPVVFDNHDTLLLTVLAYRPNSFSSTLYKPTAHKIFLYFRNGDHWQPPRISELPTVF